MKERPILMKCSMVRATRENRKSQTRRGVRMPDGFSGDKPVTLDGELCLRVTSTMRTGEQEEFMACPYGVPGDRLWVRETFFDFEKFKESPLFCALPGRAIGLPGDIVYRESDVGIGCHKWTPSIFMPRRLSRILLEVVKVRVERLQAITEADAKAEGVTPLRYTLSFRGGSMNVHAEPFRAEPDFVGQRFNVSLGHKPLHRIITKQVGHYVEAYAALWDEINGEGAWDKNRWVWVVEFKRVEGCA